MSPFWQFCRPKEMRTIKFNIDWKKIPGTIYRVARKSSYWKIPTYMFYDFFLIIGSAGLTRQSFFVLLIYFVRFEKEYIKWTTTLGHSFSHNKMNILQDFPFFLCLFAVEIFFSFLCEMLLSKGHNGTSNIWSIFFILWTSLN